MAQYDLILIQNTSVAGTDFEEKIVNLNKGDLLSAIATTKVPTVLAAGTNGYILKRDDAEVTGLKWAAETTTHTQNTDTGTTAASFDIDSDGGANVGVKLKANAGILESRNLADTAYADFKAKDITVTNLTVNGLTTTINANTLTVDDKNIEIGSVVSVAGVTGNILSTDALITGMSSTVGLIPGMTITKTAGTGVLTGTPTIVSVDSATQVTMSAVATTSGTLTATFGGASDATADGGGLTLKGATDKTIVWDSANTNWTSNQNFNLATGKVYKINNVQLNQDNFADGTTNKAYTATEKTKLALFQVAAPATATSAGTAGQTAYDSNYAYQCTATNTWRRSTLAAW